VSFPYLDVPEFKLRTSIPPSDVELFASRYPGFLERAIGTRSSYINARLRKRYGQSPTLGNNLPLGQQPPLLLAAGTLPPAVSLVGRPILGSVRIAIQITTAGALGVAVFAWAKDGGLFPIGGDQNPPSWTTGVLTAATVTLTGTGMSALFPSTGPYSLDNLYAAASPVPEAVLRWLTDFVTIDVWDRRGRNPQDPAMVSAKERYDQAMEELKEASDSKEGLFDLPIAEDADTAVTTGGPLSYSETSPYVWQDQQKAVAQSEDRALTGTGQG
jgi:hypothetical protein